MNTLQVPDRDPDLDDTVEAQNTFLDAALNNGFIFRDGGTTGTDIITPQVPSDGTLTESYTISGQRVGQRIERNNRLNGFQSRAVLFGFDSVSVPSLGTCG